MIRRTTVNLTEATDKQITYLQEAGFGTFTEITRIAIDRMYQNERSKSIMSNIAYHEVTALAVSGPIEQMPDEDVDGILLVGDTSILKYAGEHSQFGYADIELFPAVYNGQRAWLRTSSWNSAPGYSCTGLQDDVILNFDEGTKLLLEHGAFTHLFPDE